VHLKGLWLELLLFWPKTMFQLQLEKVWISSRLYVRCHLWQIKHLVPLPHYRMYGTSKSELDRDKGCLCPMFNSPCAFDYVLNLKMNKFHITKFAQLIPFHFEGMF
jgi:hypothetical protein